MERIGAYRVIRRLAAGGMGEVFLARNEAAGGVARPCVVKTILARHGGDEGARRRFVDEARLAIQLGHKNLCGVTHVGEYEGGLYMAMELVAGRDLRDILRELHARGRRLAPTLVLYILREVLEGLDYAHRAVDVATGKPLGLVHRDVSPSNLMISIEGEVKVIDFGQAVSTLKVERTAVGVVFGKLSYLSPEQARGEVLDARSDLYSLAIVATELLTGAGYYQGVPRDALVARAQAGHRSPLLDALDADLRELLALALEPDRERRTASAEQMRTRVERLLVKRQAVVGPADLRRLLSELFPGEAERQRALLAEASGSLLSGPAPSPEPRRTHDESDTAPQDGFELTEAIPTGVARALRRAGGATEPVIRSTRPKWLAPTLAAISALVLGAAALLLSLDGAGLGARPDAGTETSATAVDAGELPATHGAGAGDTKDAQDAGAPAELAQDQLGGAEGLGESNGDAIEEIEALDAGATATRTRRRAPKLNSTADKLKFLSGCRQRCAAPVLDKYSRFATLSVDEARSLATELDACVKRCGG